MRLPAHYRLLPIAVALHALFIPAAHADFTVAAGATETNGQSLASGAAGSVAATGTLSTSGSTDAVDVGTGTTTLNNAGTISQTGTGNAIDTSAATPAFTLNNQSGGVITAVGGSTVKLDVNGSYTLNNSGTIRQTGTGYAIAVDANTPNVTINNAVGGLLTASGAGSSSVILLDRAAGSFSINNQGTIWQQGSGGGTSSTTSRAIVADKNYSSTGNSIVNGSTTNSAAVIRADSNDAIRLGSNVTLTNYGSIYSTGIVNTSSASDAGQYLNGIATQGYTASDGVAINDSRSNVVILNYGSITGPRHGVDGGAPLAATANSNLTDLANSSLSGSNAQLITANTLSVTATGPNGVVFDKLLDGTTTSSVQVANPVIINYAGGSITGNNGSGVGLDGHGVVINYGSITGNYAGAGKVYQHAVNAATVTVNGQTLSTDTSSNGDGDGVDIDGVAYIYNAGSIRGTGAGGYDSGGRPNGADGIAAGGGVIINKAGATIYGQSNGILIDDGANGTLTGSTTTTARNTSTTTGAAARIYNEGSITGERKTAVGLVGNYADLLVNYGTGSILGGSSALRVDELNSTTAGAAVQMGGGNDILINYGRIEGRNGLAIDMGDGDDTLKLFGGTVLGTITGGAGDNTLETDGTQRFASGTLSNFQRFVVRGGTTTFAYGLGNVTEIKVVGGGALRIDGTFGTSGNLTVGDLTDGSGTLLATSSGAVRTIAVGGNYSQSAGGTLEIGVAGSQSDRIAATGTATLADGATIRPVAQGYVKDGSYTIVSGAGGLTATAANLNVAASGMVHYTLSKSGNDLLLAAQRTATLGNVASGGQGALGGALDSLGRGGNSAADPLFAALEALPNTAAVGEALKQTAPDTSGAGTRAVYQATNNLLDTLGSRMDGARQFGGALAQGERGLSGGDGAADRRFWIEATGGWGRQDARAGANGYDLTSGGLAFGWEADRSAREVMGLSVGYSQAKADGRDAGSGDDVRVGAVHVGGYWSRIERDLTLEASVALAHDDYSTQRRVSFAGFDQTVRGDYRGWNLAGRFEAGLPFQLGALWSGRWLGGVRLGWLTAEGYTEQGSAAVAQRVDSSDAWSVQSVLGAELTHHLPNEAALQLRARYLHEFADATDVKANFVAGGPSFTLSGAKPNRDALQLGVAYRRVTETGVTVGIGYDAEVREQYLAHQLTARVVWPF